MSNPIKYVQFNSVSLPNCSSLPHFPTYPPIHLLTQPLTHFNILPHPQVDSGPLTYDVRMILPLSPSKDALTHLKLRSFPHSIILLIDKFNLCRIIKNISIKILSYINLNTICTRTHSICKE